LSLLLLAVGFVGCRSGQKTVDPADQTARSEPITKEQKPSPPEQGGTLYPTVRIDTSLGVIDVQLNAERSPITTINFLEYVNAGFYDGTIFHRVIDKMIQGGAYDASMKLRTEGLRDPIKCESGNGLVNRRGTIGLVRTPGILDSARAQFHINRVDNYELEALTDGRGFAVFGKVVRGLDVLETIASVPVGTHPDYGAGKSPVVPHTPVVIKSVRMLTPLDWPRARELARIASRSQEEMRDELVQKFEQEAGRQAVRLDSGVAYIDLREGHGAVPTPDDSVEVYYRGMLMNETEFESSLNESKVFPMNNIIEGWKQGLSTMKEGGSRVLFIPPALGFGSSGIGPIGKVILQRPLEFCRNNNDGLF